jgi:pyruvate/2-oxoglutarate dehydrogenase complex dihydrolipoamide dehydrogenase (E3) component
MSRLIPDDAFNQMLEENVRPPGWVNPKPSGRYNLVVIGAGTAGLVTAAGAAGLGARVALVERGHMGGDCLNVGCVPSKALIRAARAAHAVRDGGPFGVRMRGSTGAADIEVDFAEVMARMRRLRAGLSPTDSAARFRSLGVDVYLGEARFTAANEVEVAGERLRFARAVIATGARATGLPIPGLENAGFLTNETVFSLTRLPAKLLVIGAGPIGCELAQAFARFGSKVTLFDVAPHVLPREDADAAALIEKRLVAEGIALHTGVKILAAERRGAEKTIRFAAAQADGAPQEAIGDEILIGVGRAPNVEGLGLETAGVAHDKAGVTVDDYLATSNRAIYAAGDICSPYKFTHAADAMARVAIQNALFFGRKKASALVIPWATYTDPEIAHVGLYAHEAKQRGVDVQSFTIELKDVDRAVLDGATEGFARAHVARGSDKLLGVTIVAEHASEMISEASLAMTHGLGLGALASTIHPYPTQGEALKKLGDAYNRTRLTPLAARVLRTILRLRR